MLPTLLLDDQKPKMHPCSSVVKWLLTKERQAGKNLNWQKP